MNGQNNAVCTEYNNIGGTDNYIDNVIITINEKYNVGASSGATNI